MGTRIEEFLDTVVATAAGANAFLRREFQQHGVEHDAESLRIESTMTAAALLSRAICEAAMHIADAIRDARKSTSRPQCAARLVHPNTGGVVECELSSAHGGPHAADDVVWTQQPNGGGLSAPRCDSVYEMGRCTRAAHHEGAHQNAELQHWGFSDMCVALEHGPDGFVADPPRRCTLLAGHAGAHLFTSRLR